MAYTKIHSVKNTFEKSLKYIKNPSKTTFVSNSKDDLKDAMRYIKNPNKTKEFVFVEGYMCDPAFCENQFIETKKKYFDAHGGRERNTTGKAAQAWHLIQSFPPDCKDPVLVHEMGMQLAEEICGKDYQAVVSTHVEGSNCLHNHIIFNAYPLDPVYGKKYHRSSAEYQRIKKCSDEIGLKYGIEPIIGGVDGKAKAKINIGEVSANRQGTSWKQKVKDDIEKACAAASNWTDFKRILIASGYT